MKVISTGDWHLGNMFHGIDRLPEQRHFLEWLLDTLVEQRPDALLVAGDVFDNGNPSEGAQKLYYGFLRELSHRFPAMHTVVIAGNHDSVRLEAPREFAELLNVHVRARVSRRWVAAGEDTPGHWERDYSDLMIPIPGSEDPSFVVLAVPYLRADVLNGGSYSEGVRSLLTELTREARNKWPGKTLIMCAHLYASGAEIPKRGSERLVIGGLEQIDLSGWEERPDFLTAGHIHKRQRIAGTEWAAYTGSVLPMSFAEKDYIHGVDLIQSRPDGTLSRERIVYSPQHKLIDIPDATASEDIGYVSLKKMIKRLLQPAVGETPGPGCPYVRLRIDREKIKPERRAELESLVESRDAVLCVVEETTATEVATVWEGETLRKIDDVLERDTIVSLEEAFLLRHGKDMNPRQLQMVNDLLMRAEE